jgi:hypothetical protein
MSALLNVREEEPLSFVIDAIRPSVEDSPTEFSGGRATIVRTGRSGTSPLFLGNGINSTPFSLPTAFCISARTSSSIAGPDTVARTSANRLLRFSVKVKRYLFFSAVR